MVSKLLFLQGVNDLPAHAVFVQLLAVLVCEIREAVRIDHLKESDFVGTEALEEPYPCGDVWGRSSVPELHGKMTVTIWPDLTGDLPSTGVRNSDCVGV